MSLKWARPRSARRSSATPRPFDDLHATGRLKSLRKVGKTLVADIDALRQEIAGTPQQPTALRP